MLKSLEINGFKSFRSNSKLVFDAPISVIVGPNGSGKSNTAEAFRFVLGEQSLKALRARHSDELLHNGGHEGRRANRASVKAVFDNSNKQLNIEYSEVVIERIIQRGDASEYRINGSRVRLKDILDLLSDANIGTSRHHIISQGEADRILNINERERKSVIEDALGLQRFYQQRRESLRKLEKTEKNLSKVKERLRDLEPEVKFLKRQKKRIDETKKIREELTEKYQYFFCRETVLLSFEKKKYHTKKEQLSIEKQNLSNKLKEVKSRIEPDIKPASNKETFEINTKIQQVENQLSNVTEELGEIRGEMQVLDRQQEEPKEQNISGILIENDVFITHKELLSSLIDESRKVNNDSDRIRLFDKFRDAIKSFLNDVTQPKINNVPFIDNTEHIKELGDRKRNILHQKNELEKEKVQLQEERNEIEKNKREEKSLRHEMEKELIELESKLQSTNIELDRCNERVADIDNKKEDLEDERSEAKILCGEEAIDTENVPLIDANNNVISETELLNSADHRKKHEFNRQLERLKIKLENTRVSDKHVVLQEYKRITEQTEFLENEVADLKESKDSLLNLINEIEKLVAEKFNDGVKRINKAFSEFFATMFGGGDASLLITEHPKGKNSRVEDLDNDPDETERGIEINIKLPNKKVSGLGVLSGGERSLVSIALLFALSQINPPPFIVLDEADAALDESNSQRFGDMIDQLSDRSQLIIVTHNRETMTRADLLYGVTMDQAGGSRLLSLNFTEALETVEN